MRFVCSVAYLMSTNGVNSEFAGLVHDRTLGGYTAGLYENIWYLVGLCLMLPDNAVIWFCKLIPHKNTRDS